MMPIGQFGVDGCHLIDGVEPNVGLEITKGVGKVVVQELHGKWSWCAGELMLATIYVI